MQIFDLKAMVSYSYEERDKNVFYKAKEFKARIIELPPGGEMPTCEMTSHVVFYVLEGEAEVRVNQKSEALEGKYGFHNIVGKNHRMREIYELVEEVAQTKATVLIQGETGTGKDLIARAIHHNSPRRNLPFVKVHCAALSESLLESELFGHVKGAFTNAYRDKIGGFELANKGTLFLDKIGDISEAIQVKLALTLLSNCGKLLLAKPN